MKNLKSILTFALIAAMMLGTVDASAKTKRTKTRTKKTTTTKTTKSTTTSDFSTQDVIDIFSLSFNYVSAMCPYECADGVVLKSASFKNKCLAVTMAFSDDFMENFGEYVDYMGENSTLDFAVKNMAVKYLIELKIPINTFAKTGIYYDFTLEDNEGKVISRKKVTNSEVVAYYNEQQAKGRSYEDQFGLEYFQDMVDNVNKSTPVDNGDGLVMTSISMDGTKINYKFEIVNDEILNNIKSMPTLVEDFMKNYMARNLYQVYTSYADGIILDKMIENGISMNFIFFEPGKSKPLMSINLPAREVKRIGESVD